ncbi:hypothetical protein E5344_05695 [Microbacterium laevaniformans]|uniref:Uncharacterized protein n=2 Tax=Microbacterium TaxID=33882 RepID=A0A4S2D9I9_9MICO|nr:MULTISPECIES: hypothetical protein [Microbacterium]AXA95525.1 hypothetical protein CEP17_03320 [Microbacterium sp. PM5]KIC57765.1 hypothetical protein RM52_09165 [Microbacterium hominis]TGY37902.1 hypothetical protein E5344_05695 [Microbacterium laevaniformans]
MTASDAAHLPDRPTGPDLAEIRAEIDELAALSTEDLVNPKPKVIAENEPIPYPTDAIGSEDGNKPA